MNRPPATGPAIGGIRLANPFVLAPMAGATDLAFRLLCREAGAALVCTEMVSDLALLGGSRRTKTIMAMSPYEGPVSCQLCGSRPDAMARAAALVHAAGADIVDINMGCPAPKIVRNHEGAALMRQPGLASEIVAAVRAAVPPTVPVTAKIRAGWDDDSVNAVEFAEMLAEAGVAAVAVHGRVRSQFYRGEADWGVIAKVKAAVKVPVIGNGDVRSGPDALRLLAETDCDAVMIGRGALGRPWLFSECLAAWRGDGGQGGITPPATRLAIARRHFRLSLALKGPWRGLVEMRKHAGWYTSGSYGAAALRQRLMVADDPAEVERLLAAAIAPPP